MSHKFLTKNLQNLLVLRFLRKMSDGENLRTARVPAKTKNLFQTILKTRGNKLHTLGPLSVYEVCEERRKRLFRE